MTDDLKTNITLYVEAVSPRVATDTAFKKLKEICLFYERDEKMALDVSDFIVGALKFQTGVIEYLHCTDGEPDKFCEAISKNKVCF